LRSTNTGGGCIVEDLKNIKSATKFTEILGPNVATKSFNWKNNFLGAMFQG
jgi:hypothetical protein